MSDALNIAWIRRDMRLHDHAVLHECTQSGKTQPIFVLDSDILARFTNKQDRRLSFIAQTLCHMHEQLKQLGGGMLVLHGRPQELVPKLAKALGAKQVICAEDFEPATRKRDEEVKAKLDATRFVQVLDHVVRHPESVLKDDGTPYRVFTPFSKSWRAGLNQHSYEEKKVSLKGNLASIEQTHKQLQEHKLAYLNLDDGAAEMLKAIGYEETDLGEWRVDDVKDRLESFILNQLEGYKDHRDFVAEAGTSKLSPYLRFGLVSVRECARLASERPGKGSDCWVNELIWREFYAQILFHFPDVVTLEFQPQYRGLNWADDDAKLQAWQEGRTGYPIVDAAMRQLVQTGWMHNRARMIVASFFTKDLHLDWRLGEEFFAQYLMDYDLASNNGGWQWAASTGTDAQPYFRIFNPELQAKKFDPKVSYIKQYVPELKELKPADIFALHREDSLLRPKDYPPPVVDHFKAKEKAIAMFKQAGEAA